MRKVLTQRGETIVEVLIVIAILSSVLATSFALTSRTVNYNRQSQERTEAVGYAQDQLERLRAIVNKDGTVTGAASNYFCIDGTGAPKSPASGGGTTVGNPTDASADNLSQYPNECNQNNLYYTIMYYDGAGNYTVYVRWDSFSGSARNNVSMIYRAKIAYLSPVIGMVRPRI